MALSRRYPLIFNPRARSQKGGRTRQFLMEHANKFALYATNTGEEAVDLAKKFAEDGEPVVIAAGGDGTLNAVVSGLAGSDTALGVMPAGTMNVFARELGITPGSLPKALEVIEEGYIREIDLFSANQAPFVQMAGVGFDAMVIEETKWETKKTLGPLAYLLSAVKILGRKPPVMEITTAEGRVEKGVAMLCGNGTLYGGQFKMFPHACNVDSKLDVIVFKAAGYKLLFDSLHGIVQGGLDMSKSTICFQTEAIKVRSEVELPVQVDGEFLGRFQEVSFRERSCRLRVLAPREPCGTPFTDAIKSLLHWPPKSYELQAKRTP